VGCSIQDKSYNFGTASWEFVGILQRGEGREGGGGPEATILHDFSYSGRKAVSSTPGKKQLQLIITT
jgi:hypothetical protein